MGTFVTLAEVLEARGSPLDEDEVWCLLLVTTEALLDVSKKGSGNMCSVLSPGSVLLSANGHMAFKSCGRNDDVASFVAPEVLQGHTASTRTTTEKTLVYSLGMTFYWCVDYQLPQNQPVQLSAELEGLLLSMCEDTVLRRMDLMTVLETCELHHKTLMLPPAERLVKHLVEDIYTNSTDPVPVRENGSLLNDRSQIIRDKLHRRTFCHSTWVTKKKISRTFSGASYTPESTGIPSGCRHAESNGSWQQFNSTYLDGRRRANSRFLAQFESTMSLNEKKMKETGPEFIRMSDEPVVVLELPGSILSKKGKSPTTQRELTVVMPNGQTIAIKCEVKSRGGDVFDMIVAHANLVEHFYFGLAYIDDNEFFFVDNDTKISKVAPDSWKKVPSTTFVLFFRIKFFVNDISTILHKQTQHQYYLQLRKDLLDDRLSCHEETALYLGALALQTEYGDCMPEVYGRNYCRPDQYVPKTVMEKRALPFILGELQRLHTNNAQMLSDESELEFLKVCLQLPEYGVLFHRATREKKPVEGEIILGVCAKGVMVYEVKDGCRSTSQTFHWRETATISSNRHRFIIECRANKKKHTFITETSKIAKYLCNLCSSQHKFNNEMNSRQLSHSMVSETPTKQGSSSDREVICVSLKKDPNLGLGIMIVGEDTVGRYDLGIFIASVVPGGPADKDGRIRPGGRLISLNHISLEGATFSEAAEVMQSSPGEVQLIISQPKAPQTPKSLRPSALKNCDSQTTVTAYGQSGNDSLDEIVSVMMEPKTNYRLHPPQEVRILNAQDDSSLSSPLNCVRSKETTVNLKKVAGSMGISITGGVNTNVPDGGIYIKSLVPGGSAERDGRIHAGDRILEVDGISFQGVTYERAVECLCKTGEMVTLAVESVPTSFARVSLSTYTDSSDPNHNVDVATRELRTTNCSSVSTHSRILCDRLRDCNFVTNENTQEVTLTRSAKGLGFSFVMCELDPPIPDLGSLIRIKELFPGQPAQLSGKINEGDVLLAINGQSLKELSYPKVLKLFKTSGLEVRLTLCRPSPGKLPTIEQLTGT
ncbi:FERM and PDZ domain-containing protein 2 [Syngnathoides biaculeatus]|uniref:FERM and PDZ domain-containing protein 2 n=1 Tax=Syngnathoides biaculeatus TaxID=300417 RepID=UPI002ADDB268|nr:FERM and PDZ domain-containing protein 2 [Syngnathoides biaculeatus]